MRAFSPHYRRLLACAILLIVAAFIVQRTHAGTLREPVQQSGQTQEQADAKSAGCITCHTSTDSVTMHPTGTVRLGCTDCHGGNAEIKITAESEPGSAAY